MSIQICTLSHEIYVDLKKESIVCYCCHFTIKSPKYNLYITHYYHTSVKPTQN